MAGLFGRAFHAPLSVELARWVLQAKLPDEHIKEAGP